MKHKCLAHLKMVYELRRDAKMIQVSGRGAESRVKGGFQYFHGIFSIWNSHFCVIPQGEIKILFEKAKGYFQKFEEDEWERKKRISKGEP